MKDFFGAKLKIGDVVAISVSHYSDLEKGVVTGFTKKRVNVDRESTRVVYMDADGEDVGWSKSCTWRNQRCFQRMNVDPKRLVKNMMNGLEDNS